MNYELCEGTIQEVLEGKKAWSLYCGDVIEFLGQLPDDSVDLVFGSPPYPEKNQRYDLDRKLDINNWIEMMYGASYHGCKVCKGDVLWVVNDYVKDSRYYPAVSGLEWTWYTRPHGFIQDRPPIWFKNATCNRKDWYSNCYERILCFRKNTVRSTWNWQTIANPPKYKSGGKYRLRDSKGKRKDGNEYPQNPLVRPIDVFEGEAGLKDVCRVTVGGGHMGSDLASYNEAPFPEKLAYYFILPLTNIGDIVVDPFCGSGTTGAVAMKNGRRFIGCDIRQNQIDLSRKRMAEALFHYLQSKAVAPS